MARVCSPGFSHELPWIVKRALYETAEPSMQLMSTHHDKYDKKWSYWRFSTWQADAREWCVVANVEHVAMVNTAYAYYPRNLSRPDQLDGIMHKLHRPGHTKDSMSFAEQGVTPFDGKVVFGPVDPTDSITNFARLSSLLFATSANIPATLSLHCESWYIRSTPL